MVIDSPAAGERSSPAIFKHSEPDTSFKPLSWRGWTCSGSRVSLGGLKVSMRRSAPPVSAAVSRKTIRCPLRGLVISCPRCAMACSSVGDRPGSLHDREGRRVGESGGDRRLGFRKYELGSYEEMCERHRWELPDRYNIATDVCDKHDRDRLAMVWEDWRGDERRISFGELQDLSAKFANVLEAHGVERGDRVATLLPSLPETAAVFLGTFKRAAILLSMSVLYGDEGIEHRLRDSGAKALVTDSQNRHRIPDGLAEIVFVMDAGEGERASADVDFAAAMEKGSDRYTAVDTAADDPAQLYYSSGTTGKAKGILHAH